MKRAIKLVVGQIVLSLITLALAPEMALAQNNPPNPCSRSKERVAKNVVAGGAAGALLGFIAGRSGKAAGIGAAIGSGAGAAVSLVPKPGCEGYKDPERPEQKGKPGDHSVSQGNPGRSSTFPRAGEISTPEDYDRRPLVYIRKAERADPQALIANLNHDLEVDGYRFIDSDRYRSDPKAQESIKYYADVLVQDVSNSSYSGNNNLWIGPVFASDYRATNQRVFRIWLTTYTQDGIGAPGMNTDVEVAVTTFTNGSRSFNFFFIIGNVSRRTTSTWNLADPATIAAQLGIDYMLQLRGK